MAGVSPQDAAAELLMRREGRRSLLSFTEQTHPTYMTGWHHREICDALQRVEQGEIDRLMIFAPPRHGKSELVSLRFPAWYLGAHPDRQIICAAYNDDLARDFGRKVRNLISSTDYERFFPEIRLSQDAKAADRWHTNHGGIYTSAGLGGTITGRGGHLIVIDDPIKNRDEAESNRMRDRVWNIYESDIQSRLMPKGAIVVMHTRWHADDLAGRLLERMEEEGGEKWHVISFPAIIDEGRETERSLWPEAFPLHDMQRRRRNTDSKTWASLYQQKPQPDEGDEFKRGWFKRYKYGQHPKVNIYIASDFAVTGGGGDFTEHGVWGLDDDDNLWAVDWWFGQETSDVWIDRLLDLAARHKPLIWFGESGQIRRAIEPALKKRMRERRVYFRSRFISPIGDKTARSRSFQARASMGKVYIPDTVWGDRLVSQLEAFPGKYDDAVDVCSIIANAIDQLMPVSKPKPKSDYGIDKWDRAFNRGLGLRALSWKVI